jgi:hypothetical protein
LQYHDFVKDVTRYLFAVSSDTFCIFCTNYVAVFRLPANQKANVASPDSNLSILESIWIYDFEGQDLMPAWEASVNVYVRNFRLDDASMYVELAKKNLVLTLRIPASDADGIVEIVEKRIPFSASVNIEAHLGDRPLLSFRLSSTHICTASESGTRNATNDTARTHLSPSRILRRLPFLRGLTSEARPKIRDNIQLDLTPRPLLLSVRSIAELRFGLGLGHKIDTLMSTGVGTLPARSIPWSTLSSSVMPWAPSGVCRPRAISHDAWSGDLFFSWRDEVDQTYVTILGFR